MCGIEQGDPMRKTVTSLFISLDGVVEAEDDWQFAYLDDDTFSALTTAWDRVDAVLMGRRSFQGFDEVRTANPDSPVIGFLSRVRRYVVSTTLTSAPWHGSTILHGDVRDQLARLKQQPGKDILVLGSPALVRWMLGQGLLDELALIILPIIVGSGPRLFPEKSAADPLTRLGLDLTNVKPLASGALQLTYTPAARQSADVSGHA
jgi:dihydrofolate reductase